MRSLLLAIAMLITGPVAAARADCLDLYPGEGEGASVCVHLSADGTQLAEHTSSYSYTSGPQEIGVVCPLVDGRMSRGQAGCAVFFIEGGEGGSEEGAGDKFTAAIDGFTAVPLRRARSHRGSSGKLRFRVRRGTLVVSRGKRVLAQVDVAAGAKLAVVGRIGDTAVAEVYEPGLGSVWIVLPLPSR